LKVAAYATAAPAVSRVLAACGKAAANGPVHLKFGAYVWSGVQDAMTAAVQQFQVANPNVTVETEFADYTTYINNLNQELLNGTQPDVAMLIPDIMPKYYARGLLHDLQGYVDESALDLSLWDSTAFDAVRFGPERRLYGVPLTFDSCVLWYNKNLFDASSAPYPNDTWTFNDLVSAARGLTKSSGGTTTQWGLGLG
jgi:multiple sugar transport system substrate-binding protein